MSLTFMHDLSGGGSGRRGRFELAVDAFEGSDEDEDAFGIDLGLDPGGEPSVLVDVFSGKSPKRPAGGSKGAAGRSGSGGGDKKRSPARRTYSLGEELRSNGELARVKLLLKELPLLRQGPRVHGFERAVLEEVLDGLLWRVYHARAHFPLQPLTHEHGQRLLEERQKRADERAAMLLPQQRRLPRGKSKAEVPATQEEDADAQFRSNLLEFCVTCPTGDAAAAAAAAAPAAGGSPELAARGETYSRARVLRQAGVCKLSLAVACDCLRRLGQRSPLLSFLHDQLAPAVFWRPQSFAGPINVYNQVPWAALALSGDGVDGDTPGVIESVFNRASLQNKGIFLAKLLGSEAERSAAKQQHGSSKSLSSVGSADSAGGPALEFSFSDDAVRVALEALDTPPAALLETILRKYPLSTVNEALADYSVLPKQLEGMRGRQSGSHPRRRVSLINLSDSGSGTDSDSDSDSSEYGSDSSSTSSTCSSKSGNSSGVLTTALGPMGRGIAEKEETNDNDNDNDGDDNGNEEDDDEDDDDNNLEGGGDERGGKRREGPARAAPHARRSTRSGSRMATTKRQSKRDSVSQFLSESKLVLSANENEKVRHRLMRNLIISEESEDVLGDALLMLLDQVSAVQCGDEFFDRIAKTDSAALRQFATRLGRTVGGSGGGGAAGGALRGGVSVNSGRGSYSSGSAARAGSTKLAMSRLVTEESKQGGVSTAELPPTWQQFLQQSPTELEAAAAKEEEETAAAFPSLDSSAHGGRGDQDDEPLAVDILILDIYLALIRRDRANASRRRPVLDFRNELELVPFVVDYMLLHHGTKAKAQAALRRMLVAVERASAKNGWVNAFRTLCGIAKEAPLGCLAIHDPVLRCVLLALDAVVDALPFLDVTGQADPDLPTVSIELCTRAVAKLRVSIPYLALDKALADFDRARVLTKRTPEACISVDDYVDFFFQSALFVASANQNSLRGVVTDFERRAALGRRRSSAAAAAKSGGALAECRLDEFQKLLNTGLERMHWNTRPGILPQDLFLALLKHNPSGLDKDSFAHAVVYYATPTHERLLYEKRTSIPRDESDSDSDSDDWSSTI